jgi:hypothetical protein
LVHNVELCKITNRIQEKIFVAPILTDDEVQTNDYLLASWIGSLPSSLRSFDLGVRDVHDSRLILKWRYLNIRHLLFRPILLDTVIRNIRFEHLASNEQAAVTKCRDIAAESISSIQAEWLPNSACCWNAVWFLSQACLIPLMALAVESPDNLDYQSWCNQVQVGITVCGQISEVSAFGGRTRLFLERLFWKAISSSQSTSQYPVPSYFSTESDAIRGSRDGRVVEKTDFPVDSPFASDLPLLVTEEVGTTSIVRDPYSNREIQPISVSALRQFSQDSQLLDERRLRDGSRIPQEDGQLR